MQPVTEDVQGHDELEEEHVVGVEATQGGAQAHGGDAIYQHVQHGAKLAACKGRVWFSDKYFILFKVVVKNITLKFEPVELLYK